MAFDDDDKKKLKFTDDPDTDESGTEEGGEGEGGQSGQIEFRDFLGGAERMRDDLLSPEEKARLLSVHQDVHEIRVKKQKELREQRQALKDGKISLQNYREGLAGNGINSQYKANPILANKAQFSGIDRQVIALPNENVAETNPEQRDELEHRYRLSHRLENAPVFNPKPQYR